MGDRDKVNGAQVNAVAGPRSKLRNRMIPFLNSPLALRLETSEQILHLAIGGSLRREIKCYVATYY
jgi:hypothetical protein